MLNSDRNGIVFEYFYLIKHFATKYYINSLNINYEELIKNGLVGLLETVDTFNPNLGLDFATAASQSIKFKMLNAIKRTSSFTKEDVLNVKTFMLDYLTYFKDDTKNDVNNMVEIDNNFKYTCLLMYTAYLKELLIGDSLEIQTSELVSFFITNLEEISDIERKLLYMFYVMELNYAQISFLLNMSQSQIFFIHTLALAKLIEFFTNKY